MIDIEGVELNPDDIRRLSHPWVGGVILFRRNFQSVEQLIALTRSIRALRTPALLIGVDHEGGRVQRFREGFTHVPPMARLGALYDVGDHERAFRMARECGWLLASELRACGVDFSFAPVLDLDYGHSSVIGDRAFHADPQVVSDLAQQFIQGLDQAGMANVVKHFPGHGFVSADSHLDLPVDTRRWEEIEARDLVPFRRLIGHGVVGVMPAHICFQQIDPQPCGFSKKWLRHILRDQLGFQGAVLSDDMMMQGAVAQYPLIGERVDAALEAGCDLVLICNRPDQVDEVLASRMPDMTPVHEVHLMRLRGRGEKDWQSLHNNKHYLQVKAAVLHLHDATTSHEEWLG